VGKKNAAKNIAALIFIKNEGMKKRVQMHFMIHIIAEVGIYGVFFTPA